MRLDLFLMHHFGFRSRTQAQEYVKKGYIYVKSSKGIWEKIVKPNFECAHDVEIRIKNLENKKWVSRSAQKLYEALEKLNLSLEGKSVLDVGQSTGGFTQASLLKGAKEVTGIDVGKGQLHENLKKDPRVTAYENIDARDIAKTRINKRFDFLVADVSFISVLKVLKPVIEFTKSYEKTSAIFLIKPQFEVGKENLDKTGVVTNSILHLGCEKNIMQTLEIWKVDVKDYFPTNLKGKDGNQEFICYCTY